MKRYVRHNLFLF